MSNIFLENAKKIRELDARIDETVPYRFKNPEQYQAWEEACHEFHSSYDSLAFPGGLENELALLKKHDPEAIELAIQFLEADPWYFGSGYNKEEFAHYLKHAPLSENQITRLNKVIIDMIARQGRRELVHYCKLSWGIQNPDLVEDIIQLLKNPDAGIVRRAKIALEIIYSQSSEKPWLK